MGTRVKPYNPIGMNPETGDYVVPRGETGGRQWWRKQFFTIKVTKPGKDFVVRHIVQQNDRDGSRLAYTKAKDGAPVLNYTAANDLARALYYRQDPIAALLAHIDLEKVTVEWLRRAGVPESLLPTATSVEKKAELQAMRTLRARGVKLPDDVIRELDLEDGRQKEYQAAQAAMVQALARAEDQDDDLDDLERADEEAEAEAQAQLDRIAEAEAQADELRKSLAESEARNAEMRSLLQDGEKTTAPARPQPDPEPDPEDEDLDDDDGDVIDLDEEVDDGDHDPLLDDLERELNEIDKDGES